MAAKKLPIKFLDAVKELNNTRNRMRKLAAEEKKMTDSLKKGLKMVGKYDSPEYLVEFENGRREVIDKKLMKRMGIYDKYTTTQKYNKLSITQKGKK